ncbi:hypothetical protein AB0941_39485 [Streptomyces sp. NPDC013433]|uniref:hypothetical protein n=1 Tax=Streptomyces sp. NPDC013433 TaxID=3155604 RepID=UPI00345208DD
MIGTVHEQDRTGDRRRPAGLGQEVGDRGDAGRVDLDDGMSLGAGEGGETVQEDGLPDARRTVHAQDGGVPRGRVRQKSAGERGERDGAPGADGSVHHGRW